MRVIKTFLAAGFAGSLAATLALMPGCSKAGGSGQAIAKLTEFKNKMCACTDKACADKVSADMAKWSSEQKPTTDKVNEEETKQLTQISTELGSCMTKIITAAAGSGSAAGSGAGSGSDATAAGSGSGGSADSAGSGSSAGAGEGSGASELMAHRAGNCPSTVLGATTKSQRQGKNVLVTVESSDKDAIAAIQKRTDELLSEKKDNVKGMAHDQKGTHGGAQGLCPVFVPDGKATAKKTAKGVVVTIAAADPAALSSEVDARITKAAEWVKSNVKDADQGNQGGVGGGKGKDGSNHSGHGDGKGHDRKGGGGGGKGTGGGKSDGGGGGSGGW